MLIRLGQANINRLANIAFGYQSEEDAKTVLKLLLEDELKAERKRQADLEKQTPEYKAEVARKKEETKERNRLKAKEKREQEKSLKLLAADPNNQALIAEIARKKQEENDKKKAEKAEQKRLKQLEDQGKASSEVQLTNSDEESHNSDSESHSDSSHSSDEHSAVELQEEDDVSSKSSNDSEDINAIIAKQFGNSKNAKKGGLKKAKCHKSQCKKQERSAERNEKGHKQEQESPGGKYRCIFCYL